MQIEITLDTKITIVDNKVTCFTVQPLGRAQQMIKFTFVHRYKYCCDELITQKIKLGIKNECKKVKKKK